jgi:hypothetical protein
MSWIGDAVAVAGAAGIGSILTQFVSRNGERRALRAKVRDELSNVEELRWAVKGPDVVMEERNRDLHAARRRLIAAALMAQIPRDLIEEYDHLAVVAFTTSKERLATSQTTSVPSEVEDCVEAAYGLIGDRLWHPLLARLSYRRRFKGLRKMVEANSKTDEGINLRFKHYKA